MVLIVGSDRFYAKKSWKPFRRVTVWIAFGEPILPDTREDKRRQREALEKQLRAAFLELYAELRSHFHIATDDLPTTSQRRKGRV